MPFKSQAQQRYFHYLESKGKMPKKTVDEFDNVTDFDHLPEHVKKYYRGGFVKDDEPPHESEMTGVDHSMPPGESFDYDMGHASDFDSSGEPHTEFDDEADHPMEFMSKGGKVPRRTMNRGAFVKALKRSAY